MYYCNMVENMYSDDVWSDQSQIVPVKNIFPIEEATNKKVSLYAHVSKLFLSTTLIY